MLCDLGIFLNISGPEYSCLCVGAILGIFMEYVELIFEVSRTVLFFFFFAQSKEGRNVSKTPHIDTKQ